MHLRRQIGYVERALIGLSRPHFELQQLHPEPLPSPKITLKEVKRAVASLAPNKAPGPDGIPNLVLQRLLPVIGDFLTNLFNDCLRLGYCPTHLRNSTTVVIRKPGKDDYTEEGPLL
jgi:hypothetical protein